MTFITKCSYNDNRELFFKGMQLNQMGNWIYTTNCLKLKTIHLIFIYVAPDIDLLKYIVYQTLFF